MSEHWKIRARINDSDGVCIGYQKPKSVPADLGRALLKRYPADWEVVERGIELPGTPAREGTRNRVTIMDDVDTDKPIPVPDLPMRSRARN